MRTITMNPVEFYNRKIKNIISTDEIKMANTQKDRIKYIFTNEPDTIYEIPFTNTLMYRYILDDAKFRRQEIAQKSDKGPELNVNGTW